MRLNSSMIGVSMIAILVAATPAHAATITWEDSGVITFVNINSINSLFPGLTVGTPWSLQVSFDPNGPATPAPGAPPGSNCNQYDMGPTTFVLGGYTYTNPGGTIWTNAMLPQIGCLNAPNGAIVFEWFGNGSGWTQEPGAWNLNGPGFLLATYNDTFHTDGTLPTVPSQGPDTAFRPGLTFWDSQATTNIFQAYPFTPTLVPEPGTLGMLGIGLAFGARRFRQRTRRR
jgi:PEP-CTERM motif